MVALAHGTSDGQKTMGVITLVLIASGLQASGTGPQLWVMLAAGLAIGLGTYSGGWRIMRTMGKGIVEIETPQGAASGAATAATILASAHLGFGLSTTHVAHRQHPRLRARPRGAEVRWSVARRMVVAWLLTLPGAALVGGLAALLVGSRSGRGIALLVAARRRLHRDLGDLPAQPDHPPQRDRQRRGAGARLGALPRPTPTTRASVGPESRQAQARSARSRRAPPDEDRVGRPGHRRRRRDDRDGRVHVLLSAGIRLVSQATVEANQAHRSVGIRTTGYGLLGLAGLVVAVRPLPDRAGPPLKL